LTIVYCVLLCFIVNFYVLLFIYAVSAVKHNKQINRNICKTAVIRSLSIDLPHGQLVTIA